MSRPSPAAATAWRAAALLLALALAGLAAGDLGALVPALLGAAAALGFASRLGRRRHPCRGPRPTRRNGVC
jgi:hypothetical protein